LGRIVRFSSRLSPVAEGLQVPVWHLKPTHSGAMATGSSKAVVVEKLHAFRGASLRRKRQDRSTVPSRRVNSARNRRRLTCSPAVH
jgi:hypothetical protein